MVVDGMALIGDGSYMMVIRIPICLRGSRRCRWLAALNCHNGDNPGVRQWQGDPDARASEVCYGILPGPWAGLSSTREGGAYRNNESWWSEVARRMGQPRNNLRSKNALGAAVVVCRVDGSVAVPAPRTDGKAGSPVRCGSWGMGDGGWGPISGQFPGRAGVDTWEEIHCPSLFQELWLPAMTARLPVVMGHRLVFTQVPCMELSASVFGALGAWKPATSQGS